MSEYTRISFEEREKIYLLEKQGLNIASIAKDLCRHKSNIYRELNRCADDPLGYIPDRAHAHTKRVYQEIKLYFWIKTYKIMSF